MLRVTTTAVTALAASIFALASCQHYEADPVTPVSIGAVSEPHLIQGARTPPYVMLVIDQSGSMSQEVSGATSKLDDVKDKFAGASGFLVSAGAGAVFGLIQFPTGKVCDPGAVVRPVGSATDDIRQSINAAVAQGGTPTAASLQAVLTDAKMSTPEAGRDRFVMLLTDGAPNCNASLNASTCTSTGGTCNPQSECCLDDDATIQQVTALANQGIKTFVIGFGNETGDKSSQAYDVLNRAAAAGGLSKSQDPKFYQANNRDDLAAALAAFGNVILTCNYTLAEAPKDLSLLEVAFVYTNDGNREEVLSPPGTSSPDWTYDASSKQVTINASRCAEIESAPAGLKVEFRYVTSL